MTRPADNTNTFPEPPARSFDPSVESDAPTAAAESAISAAATSTVSAGHTPTPTPTPFALDLPGHLCLRYLNKGGMGEVWVYHEHRHNREVAVKLCSVREEASAKGIDRFVREYETLRNLDHTKVVQVYQVGRVPGFVYYSMRFVPTGSLVKQEAAVRTSTRTAVGFMRKVAAAVEYVHRRNVLHRDLKPGNILVDEAGDPLLADFGLAWVDDGHTTTLGNAPIGTPAYMAPEVTRAGPAGCTERSDIWAVGVILYELLSGCRPFTGGRDDHAELYRSIRHDRPPPIRGAADALSDVDEQLETICLKCLAKSPAHRYQSAGELAQDLQLWLDGKPLAPSTLPDAPDVRSAAELPPAPADVAPTVTAPAPPPKPPGRWQPKLAAAALVAVLLTATVLSAVLWPRQQIATTPPVKKTLVERLSKEWDKVVFVDKSGKLVEEVGPLNGFEGTVTTRTDGRCELGTGKTYFHELFNEELPFPALYEADVAIFPSDGRPFAGMYIGRKEHHYPSGKPVHLACVNCFGLGEFDPNNPPQRKNNSVATGPAIFAPLDGTIDANSKTAFRPLFSRETVTLPADPIDPLSRPGPKHHLEIVVSAGTYRVIRDGKECDMLDAVRQRTARTLLQQYDGLTPNGPVFGGGAGLFVLHGSAVFTNVRVTRLPDPK